MATVHHSLLNVDQLIHDTQTLLNSAAPGCSHLRGDWSVRMQRLHGGLSDGLDVITVQNGRLQLQLLPSRGMGVWRGSVDGVPLQWKSPVERPVHPAFVDPLRRGGIGWLDGFNELICRCGLGWHGAPGTDVIHDENGNVVSEQFLPLHGRIANLPAHQVDVSLSDADGGSIAVTAIVDEASMFGGRLRLQSTLTTALNSAEFHITDVVTNLGSSPAEVEMLYHCNIGEPFLGEGSVFHGAASEIAPRDQRAAEGINMWNVCAGPTPGYSEQVYFTRPAANAEGCGLAVLANAAEDLAFGVRFDTSTLPWFVLWKNTQPLQDGYVIGLEPASSFPNLRTIERKHGRVRQLPAGASVAFHLSFVAATQRDQVRQLLDEVTALQVATPRTVHNTPHPNWRG